MERTLDLALTYTWFSMSLLDLVCGVPAFLMASSLEGSTRINNSELTAVTGTLLDNNNVSDGFMAIKLLIEPFPKRIFQFVASKI